MTAAKFASSAAATAPLVWPFQMKPRSRPDRRVVRVSGNGLPKGFPKSKFGRLPAGQIVNCRFTDEEEDDRHHQERAEHKAQHPGWRHIVSQKARDKWPSGIPPC
jgi:hypothetical protein